MAISTLDQALAGQLPPVSFLKLSVTTEGAGTWHSLWTAAGNPGPGATPPAASAGAGYIATKNTAGALRFSNPLVGNSYLSRLSASGSVAGTVILADRLWACSGFNTTLLTLSS